jgi:hypothetical protein
VLAATMGWGFNEVANDIDEVAGQLVSSGDHHVSSAKLPWFSGQEHRVYCEQVSHARIVAGHNQTQHLISQVDGLQSVSGSWSLYGTTAGPAPAGTRHVRVVLVADTGSAVDFDEVTLEVSSTPFR